MRAQTREGVASRIKRARDAHHSRFALRHHAIQALPISGKDKQALYKALRAERAVAERALRFKIKAWRAAGPKLHTPTWKAFLAERAADGDLRAVRRLARNRNALGIQIRSSERNALPRDGQRTSRGTRVHDIGGGARIRESSGLLELVGDPSPDALAQLAGFAEKRFRGESRPNARESGRQEQLEAAHSWTRPSDSQRKRARALADGTRRPAVGGLPRSCRALRAEPMRRQSRVYQLSLSAITVVPLRFAHLGAGRQLRLGGSLSASGATSCQPEVNEEKQRHPGVSLTG